MLNIVNLQVAVVQDNAPAKQILKDLSLQVKPGSIHVIIGPNGSGKSTLANVLIGSPGYHTTCTSCTFAGEDLLSLAVEERAKRGMFMTFQHPVAIPGVNSAYFLRAALNELRQYRNLPPIDAADFLALMQQGLAEVGLSSTFAERAVNEGFSGGEKKRHELLQMLLLEPSLIIMDEIDSGLDYSALAMLQSTIRRLRDQARSFIIITHNFTLLDTIVPDMVHLMHNGTIVKSGSKQLIDEFMAQSSGS